MIAAEERAQFKVPAEMRAAVRAVAAQDEVPESVVWRRVVKAGVVALGLVAAEPSKIEVVRGQLADLERGIFGRTTADSPVVPVSTDAGPAGWETIDPIDDIA